MSITNGLFDEVITEELTQTEEIKQKIIERLTALDVIDTYDVVELCLEFNAYGLTSETKEWNAKNFKKQTEHYGFNYEVFKRRKYVCEEHGLIYDAANASKNIFINQALLIKDEKEENISKQEDEKTVINEQEFSAMDFMGQNVNPEITITEEVEEVEEIKEKIIQPEKVEEVEVSTTTAIEAEIVTVVESEAKEVKEVTELEFKNEGPKTQTNFNTINIDELIDKANEIKAPVKENDEANKALTVEKFIKDSKEFSPVEETEATTPAQESVKKMETEVIEVTEVEEMTDFEIDGISVEAEIEDISDVAEITLDLDESIVKTLSHDELVKEPLKDTEKVMPIEGDNKPATKINDVSFKDLIAADKVNDETVNLADLLNEDIPSEIDDILSELLEDIEDDEDEAEVTEVVAPKTKVDFSFITNTKDKMINLHLLAKIKNFFKNITNKAFVHQDVEVVEEQLAILNQAKNLKITDGAICSYNDANELVWVIDDNGYHGPLNELSEAVRAKYE